MHLSARSRALQWLQRHVPELADVAIIELGHGFDNTAFLTGDLVVRVAEGDTVLRESRLLEVVAAHVSVPVPAVRYADPDAGVLAYPLLLGQPLLGRPAGAYLAQRIGRFLSELHAIDAAAVDGMVPVEHAHPSEWLEDLDGPAELLRVLQASMPEPAQRRVLAHADLGAEHILEQDGDITGVIDWTDAAITDPALDFARLYRDFGPDFLAAALDAYGGPPEPDSFSERIMFFARCAALEDLAFGREHGRSEYTRTAERSVAWLFPSSTF